MQQIKISDLQRLIGQVEAKKGFIDIFFVLLIEKVGELTKAIRSNTRLKENKNIEGTIEEKLYNVIYYVVCLANEYDIDLEECAILVEKLNAKKDNRKSIFNDENEKLFSN